MYTSCSAIYLRPAAGWRRGARGAWPPPPGRAPAPAAGTAAAARARGEPADNHMSTTGEVT